MIAIPRIRISIRINSQTYESTEIISWLMALSKRIHREVGIGSQAGQSTLSLSKPLAMSGRMTSIDRELSSPKRKSRSHVRTTPPMAPWGASSLAWTVGPSMVPHGHGGHPQKIVVRQQLQKVHGTAHPTGICIGTARRIEDGAVIPNRRLRRTSLGAVVSPGVFY